MTKSIGFRLVSMLALALAAALVSGPVLRGFQGRRRGGARAGARSLLPCGSTATRARPINTPASSPRVSRRRPGSGCRRLLRQVQGGGQGHRGGTPGSRGRKHPRGALRRHRVAGERPPSATRRAGRGRGPRPVQGTGGRLGRGAGTEGSPHRASHPAPRPGSRARSSRPYGSRGRAKTTSSRRFSSESFIRAHGTIRSSSTTSTSVCTVSIRKRRCGSAARSRRPEIRHQVKPETTEEARQHPAFRAR